MLAQGGGVFGKEARRAPVVAEGHDAAASGERGEQ
jgi:hypothetical protein